MLVVPSGALTALPFHLLVTEKPAAAIPDKFDGYREAAWLLKRQAVSVLPSVASLKALRVFARKDQSTKPMIGFGDPLFNPARRTIAGDKTRRDSGPMAASAAAALTDRCLYRFLAGRRRRSRAARAGACRNCRIRPTN